jgi:DNA-binding transcriptional LysR family regulator
LATIQFQFERRGSPERPRDLLAHDCICHRSSTTGALYVWELKRGKKTWRVPVRAATARRCWWRWSLVLAEAGLGLTYAFEPQVAPFLKRGSLRLVLEAFAASVPGFFLYFPSRAQVSPALRAFMDTAREVTVRPRKDSR